MRKKWVIVILICFVGLGFYLWQTRASRKANVLSDSTQTQNVAETPPTSPEQPKHSLTDPASIWVVVNKNQGIPVSYVPTDLVVPDVTLRLGADQEQMQLRKIALEPLSDMFSAAQSEGVALVFGSGYRSGNLQKEFYDSYKARDGQKAADTYSARPGFSEHQTGLALDVTNPSQTCNLEVCFADTKEGAWIAKNAHKYGFIIRYPKNKQSITGYQYEPWHLRYVGTDLALQLYDSKQTMEEYFKLNPAPSY